LSFKKVKSFLLESLLRLDQEERECVDDDLLKVFKTEDKLSVFSSINSHNKNVSYQIKGVPGLALIRTSCVGIFGRFATMVSTRGVIFEHYMNNTKAVQRMSLLDKLTAIILPYYLLIAKKSREEIIIVATRWDTNYFHWTVEVIPKLLFLKEYCRQRSIKILLHENEAGFSKEWLEKIDFPSELIVWHSRAPKFYEKSYYLQFHRKQGRTHTGALDSVRNFARQHFPSGSSQQKRFYISREDASKRRVLQEYKFIPLLKAQGFEIVTLTGLSLLDQITLFRSASTIIAPHGAGLTNLIYCEPNTTVIEFLPNKNPVYCYASMCSDLNLIYNFLPCEMENEDFKISDNEMKKVLSLC